MLQQLLLNGIVAGSVYALVALGFALIYRTVRFFHFAHGAVYTLGAYIAYTFVVWLHVNMVLAFFVVALISGVLGAALDRIVYQPLRREKAPNLVFLIVSIGAFIFIQNLVQLIYGAEIRILRTGNVEEGHRILSVVITDIQSIILAAALATMIILSLIVHRTKLGKAIRAVSDDAVAAAVVGINPERIILAAVFLGSALAGVAGALLALETNLQPTMGLTAILKGIVASIVGGIGSVPGAILGGLLLGVAENLGIWKIDSAWKDTISYVFLVGFLLARPGGVLGVRVRANASLAQMEYLFHIGVIAGIYVILAQSLNLIVGYTGQAALGHAGFYCCGAYVSALLSLHFGISPWLSTLAAAGVGGVAGMLASYPSIRLKGDYLALATFGAGIILYSIAMNWVSVTRGPMGISGIPSYTIFGEQLQLPELYFFLAAAAAAVTVTTIGLIVRSPFGRVLQAIRDDEIAAMALGKNVAMNKIAVFGVGGSFAGVAGALYAHYVTFIDPTTFTAMESITILLMVVLGGMGTLQGPILGAVVLVAFPQLLRLLDVPSSIAGPLPQMLYGLILIVLMMRRPQGLLGVYKLR